jgi:hypothetical protein
MDKITGYDIIPQKLNPRQYIGSLKFVPYSIHAKKLEKFISTTIITEKREEKSRALHAVEQRNT